MDVIRAFAAAIDRAAGDEIDGILEHHFYRILLIDPAHLDRAFASMPPGWVEGHPRRELWRALTASLGAGRQIPTPVLERFAAFVRHDETARPADALVLMHVRLAELIAHGWGDRTSPLVEQISATARAAEDRTGLADVLPVLFALCAVARVLADADTEAAAALLDAQRWASLGEEGHPALPHVNAHLAVWCALEERYVEAALLLEDPRPPQVRGTLAHRYRSVALIARALVAVGSLDADEAERSIALIDEPTATGEFEWLVLHAKARVAALQNRPWDMIHVIGTTLGMQQARYPPASNIGAVLRADLAHLSQIADDARASERVLSTPGLREENRCVAESRVRQALVRGRPAEALSLLEDRLWDGFALSHHPRGAVLRASAELAARGDVTEGTLGAAAAVVRSHGSFVALTEATPALRPRLLPLLDVAPDEVPQLWTCTERIRLTRREQQVLRVLGTHVAIPDIAAALYVSEAAAAASLKTLYRKIGARTREEALWLAGAE